MKLVVGLGNPGEKYRETRHNIGAALVERYASRHGIEFRSERSASRLAETVVEEERVMFLIPQTYMNRSGEAVGEAMRVHRIPAERVMVVHDDIDLVLGRVKGEYNAGAAGHKGVVSIMDRLETGAFHRIRLGIGRPGTKEEVEAYVLSPFAVEEGPVVTRMLEEGEKDLHDWIVGKDQT